MPQPYASTHHGWSWDRPFTLALIFSALWHLFWFFSVNIVVAPQKMRFKQHPQLVSLGPVLDDSIFRTLVETRPQISETLYRRLSDYTSTVDLEVQTMERHTPGDVVSVPFGKKFLNSVRDLVGGEKSAPAHEFISRIKINYGEDNQTIEGEAKSRRVLNKPDEPVFPEGFDPALRNGQTELQFTVNESGVVQNCHARP